jgi:phosphoglycerate dehydrogenase-like enzyme
LLDVVGVRQEKWRGFAGIAKGGGLNVFYQKPLPKDSPLYTLDNVFMSPHCADRTKEFQLESMEVFVENMPRYIAGDQLVNVVDKARG